MRLRNIVLLMVAAALGLAAQQAKLPGEDWVSLFNGKDLTGWVEIGNEKWVVEDGTIHGHGDHKKYGYLQTEKKYKDFEIGIRFKCEGDGNSGVFSTSTSSPARRMSARACSSRSTARSISTPAEFTATAAAGSFGPRRRTRPSSGRRNGTNTC